MSPQVKFPHQYLNIMYLYALFYSAITFLSPHSLKVCASVLMVQSMVQWHQFSSSWVHYTPPHLNWAWLYSGDYFPCRIQAAAFPKPRDFIRTRVTGFPYCLSCQCHCHTLHPRRPIVGYSSCSSFFCPKCLDIPPPSISASTLWTLSKLLLFTWT